MAHFFNFGVFCEFWPFWAWPLTCDFLRSFLKTILMHMGHHQQELSSSIRYETFHGLSLLRHKFLFFSFLNSFRYLTLNRVYSCKQNDNRNLDPIVGKLIKFATYEVKVILGQTASFGSKIAIRKRPFSQNTLKIFPRLMTS